MGSFSVEQVRGGVVVRRAVVQAQRFEEAAKAWGPVTDGLGREPASGEWIRVTHFASGRTNWFRVAE